MSDNDYPNNLNLDTLNIMTCSRCRKSADVTADHHAWDAWMIYLDSAGREVKICPACQKKETFDQQNGSKIV